MKLILLWFAVSIVTWLAYLAGKALACGCFVDTVELVCGVIKGILEQRRGAVRRNLLQSPAVAAPSFYHDIHLIHNEGEARSGHTLIGKATAPRLQITSSAAPGRLQVIRGGNAHQRRTQRRRLARAGVIAALLFVATAWVRGQSGAMPQVKISWTSSPSQCTANCGVGQGPTLINVYRVPLPPDGTCAGAQSWQQAAAGVPPLGPYLDTPPGYGGWCYMLRAYLVAAPTVESVNSNVAYVAVLPAAPTGVKAAQQ